MNQKKVFDKPVICGLDSCRKELPAGAAVLDLNSGKYFCGDMGVSHAGDYRCRGNKIEPIAVTIEYTSAVDSGT